MTNGSNQPYVRYHFSYDQENTERTALTNRMYATTVPMTRKNIESTALITRIGTNTKWDSWSDADDS